MLGQHIKPAPTEGCAIKPVGGNFGLRRHTFQIFKPVGRHQNGTARFIQPVIGPSHTLQQTADPFRCANLDHKIDIGPVQPQIKRAGGHHTVKPASRHHRFDFAAQFTFQRPVMHGDAQIVLIQLP